MRLPATAHATSAAIAAARAFAATTALPDEAADRLAIVVEEWVANIVEHAAAPAGSLIVLGLSRAGQGVRVGFSDAGVAFDPRTILDASPNLERGGGAGIAMIRAWCVISGYRRAGGRNRLALDLKVG